MKRVKTSTRIGAAFVVAPAALLLAAGPALAADNVAVSNQETVQAHLDALGNVKDARVYEQLAMQGNGTVAISDPVSTKNLRNLDGFGGFDVRNGNLVGSFSVDGERRVRTVSDFTKSLPLKVSVTYKLDGRTVQPGDVVGKSGTLEVHYKVENVTGRDQDVTYDDGTGKQVTQSQNVVIPMVGSLTTTLPSSFTNVRSGEAAIAGDGHGGTQMTFTMTLFGPIGSPTAEFGYAAKVTDGVIPAATVSALPVSPLDSPSFKGGAASYKGGADTGLQLTSGAAQIDANVLKLRDGAAQLLAGLIQLRDGAKQLDTGLAGQAAPGAAKLATGAGQVNTGASQLASGIKQIRAGVTTLSATVAKDSGFLQLKGALASLEAGVGTLSDTGSDTLLGGLNQLKYGLRSPLGTPLHPVSGAGCDPNATAGATVCGAADGVQLIQSNLDLASKDGGSIDQLLGAANGAYDAVVALSAMTGQTCPARVGTPLTPLTLPQLTAFNPANQACYAAASAAYGYGAAAGAPGFPAGGLKVQSALAAAKLQAIYAGLDGLAIPGIESLKKALYNSSCNPLQTVKTAADFCGVSQAAGLISSGVDQLVASIATQLSGPLSQASTGANQLAGGTAALSAGAQDLSSGLQDAAAGSGQLADGLTKAADSAPALPDGASRLSAEGTTKLVDSGKTTAADYGLKYALIEAGAERAKAEGMAYGAPANAQGETAYSLELAGMTGEGGKNVGRGLGALAVFGLGAGVTVMRRRWV